MSNVTISMEITYSFHAFKESTIHNFESLQSRVNIADILHENLNTTIKTIFIHIIKWLNKFEERVVCKCISYMVYGKIVPNTK